MKKKRFKKAKTQAEYAYEAECKRRIELGKLNAAKRRVAAQKKKERSRAEIELRKYEEKDIVLYVIEANGALATKVGITSNLSHRLKALQTGNHLKLSIHYFVDCQTMKRAKTIESWVHERLRPFHINGEWFELTGEQCKEAVEAVIGIPKLTKLHC